MKAAANFGFISPMKLNYNWALIWNFEIWGFISPFVFAGIFQRDMVALMTLYNLVTFSQHHEMGPYNTGAGSCTADYAFALMFGMMTIILTHPLMNMIRMPASPCCNSLIFFVIYGWSKRYPNAPVSLWFFQMKAIQFPFAHVLFNVVTCRGISSLVHGIAVGHLYYFLVDVFPVVYGKDILHTPQILIDVFGGEGGSMSAGYDMYRPKGKAGMEGPTKKKRAHSWGTGQALGSKK